MSDDSDEDVGYKRPAKTFKMGSLAEPGAIERIQEISKKESESKAASTPEADGPNINVSGEYYQLEKMVNPAKEAMIAEFDRRKRARQLTLPTDDFEVKMMLRQLDYPICIFGEERPDRRERLRLLLSEMDEEEVSKILHKDDPTPYRARDDEATWYHEGSEALRTARVFLAKYSIPRAQARLDAARNVRNTPAQQRAVKLQESHKWVRNCTNYGSQVGDVRPISFVEFGPKSDLIATASWSGLCKLWSVPECRQIRTFKGHNASAGCIRFHPFSGSTADPEALNLATCGHDGTVFLWSLDSDEPIADLEGHAPYRVSRLAFHPSGRFLATCCHDNSWRLFDLEMNEEVLYQEGHSKAVFDIAFQDDGSVALTGGMDAYGRVWDLRTGRCIMFLEGHQNHVLSVDFSPNGYQMGSGSADNTVKIWDLRMRRCIYTLPAHKSLVSRIKFDVHSSAFILTGSYDNTVKIWSAPGYQQLKQLSGHDSKVMCVDVSKNGKWIASSSFDRTFKLWAPDSY